VPPCLRLAEVRDAGRQTHTAAKRVAFGAGAAHARGCETPVYGTEHTVASARPATFAKERLCQSVVSGPGYCRLASCREPTETRAAGILGRVQSFRVVRLLDSVSSFPVSLVP
jgi:hypothetical protein